MYNDISIFKARALEEVKRAKRYLTFVSMVSFDISHIENLEYIENYKSIDSFYIALRNMVMDASRDTDIVSGVSNGRLFVLLPETPKEGAQIFSDRLKENIKYFLVNKAKSPLNWRVATQESYFPGSKNTSDNLFTALQNIDN